MKKRLIKTLFFVLMVSVVVGGAMAESQTRYKVHVINDSQQSGNVCVYQIFPDQETNNNMYSLAWFSKAIHPDTTIIFEWDQKYSFVWRESGELTPNMKFVASESKQADPNNVNNNYALFGRENDAYLFKDTIEQGEEGILTIQADNTIPNNKASVGIGVGGKAAIVVNAFANMPYQFTPEPSYWIVFGNFEEGQVLDLHVINRKEGGGLSQPMENFFSQPTEIVFPVNVYERSLRFAEDNTWEVLATNVK